MNDVATLDELLTCRLASTPRKIEPCSIVIFGASGDLTGRKLVPALYHLHVNKLLPQPCRVIGFARREKSDDSWREELLQALRQFSRTREVEPAQWAAFAANLSYCRGEFDDPAAYRRLADQLAATPEESLRRNHLFYLATSPSQFAPIAARLAATRLLRKDLAGPGWQRLVVEKPFGQDFPSAQVLNAELTRHAHEKQLFRIDHYLGKETVQNILLFRFSNALFERVWHREAVDHVQITVSEKLGVGARGIFYEEAGALRDVVQNHLLQILALVAMEPPVTLEAEAIRDEKVKLLKSIRLLPPHAAAAAAVRGQYAAGEIDGSPRLAYRAEQNVRADSNVETYAALRLWIDNWRWAGVPFFIRAGKSLARTASEVRVQFKPPPSVLFAAQCGPNLDANSITLRLQPNEGITLHFNGKIPGIDMRLRPVRMHFSYNSEFGAYTPEAYERLLLDAIAGDATLFIRRDEVEASWRVVDPVREGWGDRPLNGAEFYPAGSWGPGAADQLISSTQSGWRNPQPAS